MTTRPELLCPAGDAERLEAALYFGADAVYLGGEAFGMRSSPQNFSSAALPHAVQKAHPADPKAQLTSQPLFRTDVPYTPPSF